MRSKNTVTIILGVVLALLGAGVAVAATRTGGSDSGGGATRRVVVAVRAVPAGTPASDDSLALRDVPRSAVPADAVTSLDALSGQVALLDLGANQVVTKSMYGVQGVAVAGGVKLPPGKKAIGVELEFAPGALRYVVPGDRIDIYASQKTGDGPGALVRTSVLLTGVQVIATTPGAGNGAPSAVESGTGTLDFLLAVDQGQALKIVHAKAMKMDLYFTLSARKGAA